MNGRHGGFTLLEMLVVLAVIAILLSIGFFSYRRYIARQNLTEAQQSLAQALNTARSESRRLSLDRRVQWKKGGNLLTVLSGDGATKIRDVPIPNGLTLTSKDTSPVGTTLNFTYTAPYGRTDAINTEFDLVNNTYGMTAIVRVIGVTGKVVRSAR